jgi:hypothetical protein
LDDAPVLSREAFKAWVDSHLEAGTSDSSMRMACHPVREADEGGQFCAMRITKAP